MIGTIEKSTPISNYQPSLDVCKLTERVKKDYNIGTTILNKQYMELNNRSVIDDENRGQLMFNAFVDEEVEDQNDAWKWRGTRSMARNKGIAMHAQLTSSYLLPIFIAQNEDDEVDRDFSEVMRDVIEWMAEPTSSNYQSSFLQIVFGMMHNPVTYLGAEYCEVFQTIKDRLQDGKVSKKEVLDEVLSGFQAPIYSSSQILITNAFERNIQKQDRIIKRQYREYEELESKYGHHKNWQFVQRGIRAVYNEENGVFYNVKDADDFNQLIAEEIWECRKEDSEIPFLNGIYLGEDDLEANPIRHRDNLDRPKYNIVPFGYARIGEHFFYYKSMMNCLGWDNLMYDAMSEVVMNRSFLEVEMPIAISGTDQIDSEIVFPNSVVTFEEKDARVQKLLPDSNMVGGFNALRETEKSMNESSVNETLSGNLPDASQKAYNVAQAQAAAKKLVSGIGKNLAESMCMYGDLMKDIAINNITAPQVDELVGGNLKLKYRTLLMESSVGTHKKSKKIKFDPSLIGLELTDEEKENEDVKLAEEAGYPDKDESIMRVNPELFAKFRYLSKIDLEEMFPKNAEYWQPVLLNLKSALAKDPYTNQETLTKELMHSYFQSRGDNFVAKPQASPMQQIGSETGANPLGEQVNQKQLASVSGGGVV